ncbi:MULTISPECIES: hypothetical protein [unclassified Duganella]|uniref:hypothetical protein n=1 Tax=unclassified Duganella TaxID=2636909 RepID=UPI0006FD5D3A|nr:MULTISPECIES: hypothetical protein [unclassified Duganella]KQV42957.1 hypothetical protein ASD07_21155 [Duganella sp. Root336D2]KRB97083.1 hypothetical protein ASE26_03340 [Duganella sp. Root198D2]
MQADFRPARRAWLAVIALLHLAVFLCWRGLPERREAGPLRESELVYLLAPPEPSTAAAPARRAAGRPKPPLPSVRAVPAPAASVSEPALAEAVTVPASAGDPGDPFAKPAAPAESLLERNRKLAAGVDRQLRKESLNQFATIVPEQSPLARQLARAYKGEVVLEQVSTMADGRSVKRYRAGGQEWCEVVNLVGAAGQDPFRDGNKYQVKTCP